MVLVRPCMIDDFEELRELVKEFHDEAFNEYGLKFDNDSVLKTIEEHYRECLLLIKDNELVGAIAGQIVNAPLDNNKIFQEMMWYVKKEHRSHGGRLLKELESRCRDRGVVAIIMVAIGSSMAERLNKYYNRLGYKHLETHYIKALGV